MDKEQANFRLDAAIKHQAYEVLGKIGIKPTDAVNMFMHHVAMYGELPFRPSIPNAKTLQTFADTDADKGLTRHASVDAIFAKLKS